MTNDESRQDRFGSVSKEIPGRLKSIFGAPMVAHSLIYHYNQVFIHQHIYLINVDIKIYMISGTLRNGRFLSKCRLFQSWDKNLHNKHSLYADTRQIQIYRT